MKRIAIFGNRHQEGFIPEIEHLLHSLDANGFEISINRRFFQYLKSKSLALPPSAKPVDLPDTDTECILSIGGDGTFLRTAEWAGESEIPILGINTGHLGFLASYYLSEITEITDTLITDNGLREKRALLRIHCDAMPPDFPPFALNEFVIQRGDNASLLNVHAEIDGHFLADYLADGLIVSTPTGSTAYNLSIGGPILQPTLSCFVISPIAPHSLTMRPLVVDAVSKLRFSTNSRGRTALVSMDGRSFTIDCDKCDIEITKAPYRVTVLRRPDSDFSHILRNKLLWGK